MYWEARSAKHKKMTGDFSWIFSVPPRKYWDGSPHRPRPLPSTTIAIYYSLFMLLLAAKANNMGHWQRHYISTKYTQSDTPVSWGTFQTKTVSCADPLTCPKVWTPCLAASAINKFKDLVSVSGEFVWELGWAKWWWDRLFCSTSVLPVSVTESALRTHSNDTCRMTDEPVRGCRYGGWHERIER